MNETLQKIIDEIENDKQLTRHKRAILAEKILKMKQPIYGLPSTDLSKYCSEREGCTARLHVHWCPEDYWCKEYEKLPWYKKLFRFNPRNL